MVATSELTVESIPTPTPSPTPLAIQSLSFAQTNVSITKGNTLKLVVEVKPNELSGSILSWTSSDSNIVTVNENGLITGINEGVATITVTSSNGKKATCTVNVTTDVIDVTDITLTASKTTIKVNDVVQINATVAPENATNRELVWSSSDTVVATVDSNGLVTGINPGVVTITAQTVDGKVEETITITVEALPTPTPTPTPSPTPTPEPDELLIYDDDHDYLSWNGAVDLKIFTKSKYNIDGVIAPESENTYEFVIKNSMSFDIKYKISFDESNDYGVNMKYKLKKNGVYVVDHYVSCNELNLSEQLLNAGTNDTFELEWKWVSSTYEADTLIGQNLEANYGLKILIEADGV